MSITPIHNIIELDNKIEYLLKEKSIALEEEHRMTEEVIRKIKANCQTYYHEPKNPTHIKTNIISKKYKHVAFLGFLIIIPLFLVVILPSNLELITDKENKMTSGYLVQNLKGDTIDTFHSWDIPKERTLYVNIVNSNVVGKDKIQVIKDSILSEKTVSIDNSVFHKTLSGSESTYYLGWSGALKQASNTPTKFSIPTNFSIDDTSRNGDITIILSTLSSPDGYSGFTRSTVENNQILKSVITVYKADQLSSAELETIIRHEFGHAVGLIHSSDPDDLMHSTIETNYPFISNCDVLAVTKLYDGISNNKVTCEI